jgi:hypothetical protein
MNLRFEVSLIARWVFTNKKEVQNNYAFLLDEVFFGGNVIFFFKIGYLFSIFMGLKNLFISLEVSNKLSFALSVNCIL